MLHDDASSRLVRKVNNPDLYRHLFQGSIERFPFVTSVSYLGR